MIIDTNYLYVIRSKYVTYVNIILNLSVRLYMKDIWLLGKEYLKRYL